MWPKRVFPDGMLCDATAGVNGGDEAGVAGDLA